MKVEDEVENIIPPRASLTKPIVKHVVHAMWGNPKYNPDTYPQLAFDVLSKKRLQSLTHLANALDCSKSSIDRWRKKFPDFNNAVIRGLCEGEAKLRDEMNKRAFKPSKDVTMRMISLLAGNVYSIKEDNKQQIINHHYNNTTPEEELLKRGIRIPVSEIENIPEIIKDECDRNCDDCEIEECLEETND